MFTPATAVAAAFGEHLARIHEAVFPGHAEDDAAFIAECARLVLERLAKSDALYHTAEHTMMVTLVGQQILRGRQMADRLHPDDWLHFTVACLLHDIGYVRDACPGDTASAVVTGPGGTTVTPPRGASDAFLGPWHVDRGIIHVRHRFGTSDRIDAERVARAVDFTRFPVPDAAPYRETEGEGALLRSADLIGQMADPYYHRKTNALYHEFVETGVAEELGYTSPRDLTERYPDFFWSSVEPLIGPALADLERTPEGRQWVTRLYDQVFRAGRPDSTLGPFPGPDAAGA